MRTIEIIVSPQGEALVETKGFAGSECQKASEFLQKALGQQTAERLTGEFFARQDDKHTIQQKGAW